ncbi:MAG: DHA2 family efflux MFS transporter permease subunit [Planctomycetia bacterium]|nr:DHA2 family efflux MFS transporter permease subunit [Planctomycetia bacterium]
MALGMWPSHAGWVEVAVASAADGDGATVIRGRRHREMDMDRRVRNTVVALVVASVTFMELLDATVLTTALPAMATSLAVTVIDLKAAITTYLVTLAIFIPISGWIADRLGTKTTLLAAIAVFTVSSAACGMARSLEALVVFRAAQGVGGALMTPVARLVIVRLFDREDLVRVAGLVAMPMVLGPVIGPLLGGYITTRYSWPWVFFVNVPVGIAACAAIAVLAENHRPPSRARFDVWGFLAVGLGLAILTYTIESLDSHSFSAATVAGLFATGLLLLILAVVHCLRSSAGVLDLSLLATNTFRVGVLQALVGMVACGGLPLLIAILLQSQLGYSPLQSGVVLFCSAVGSLAIKPWIARVIKRIGTRAVLAAYPLGLAAVLLLLSRTGSHTSPWQFGTLLFLFGCGQSVFMNMVNAVPFLDVSPEQTSKATSLQGTILQFSMSLGISFSVLLLDWRLDAGHLTLGAQTHVEAILGSFHFVFLVMAAVSAANAWVGLSFADDRTEPAPALGTRQAGAP